MFQKHSRMMIAFWAALAPAAVGLWLALPKSLRHQIAPTAHAATFTVNTADDHDDGICNTADCTLREAINAVNAGSGGETISFNISGSGVRTINATAGFRIAKSVTIDGASQPGFAGTPLIELNGAAAGAGVNGFNVNAANVTIKGLIVNRFSGYGISFDSSGNSTVQGCYIGTNAAGNAASANVAGGIRINGVGVSVGGTTTSAGNVISGNKGNGIDVFAGGAIIEGNFIGLNSAGATQVGNVSGVVIDGAANNRIGGTTAAARNIISGNSQAGVRIVNSGATNNLIQGNFIGTNVNGTITYVPNAFGLSNVTGNSNGIQVMTGAQNTAIGGTAPGARNVITGNFGAGVLVSDGNGISIAGNFIGLDAGGNSAGGNYANGIKISGGSAVVGGTEPGAGNVISGNGVILPIRVRPEALMPEQFAVGSGVLILGGSSSQVLGNFIGTKADGTAATTPFSVEGQIGVSIINSANNLVGGTTAAARNVISGNVEGVLISGTGATNNIVQGNFIGVDVNGSGALGNGLYGVEISNGASNNSIGGTTTAAGNTIAFNGYAYRYSTGPGVFVQSGTGNAILGNSIFSNNGLGLDLAPLNATNPNDNCDSDAGANNQQNYPVITSARSDATTTTVQGTLNSTANTQFRIEFFANTACHPSSNGEGQTFLGFTNATTDAACVANFSFSVPNAAVTAPIITATATDLNNNTSEFSTCIAPMGTLPTIQFSAPSYTVGEGDKRIEIPIRRTGDTSTAASVSFATNYLNVRQNCEVINGIAVSGCDYEPQQVNVKFAPGETLKTIPIYTIDDSYAEGPETFDIRLTNAAGAYVGAPAEASVTIVDNDLATGPNPIDTPRFFVRQHYLDFLNREPDPAGLDFWTNQITSCGADQACIQEKRINVSTSFFLSVEFQQIGYFVARVYRTAYGPGIGVAPAVRLNEFLADSQQVGAGVIVGQSDWETVLENNKRAFTLDFVQRPRFLGIYPTTKTPQRFVDDLFILAGGTTEFNPYRLAAIAEFGGAADTSDMAARSRALRIIAENPTLQQYEFSRALVLMQYFGYLRRNPDDYPDSDSSGYNFWWRKLFDFNGDFQKAEMIKAFITSNEYRKRFGP